MANPIFSGFGQQNQPPQNNLIAMLNQIRKSPNPNAAAASMLSPEMQTYISQNGGDAKTAFYNLAAQKGIDPNQILNTLRGFM